MLDAPLYCFPFHSFGTRSLTKPRQAASTLLSLPFPALGLQCTYGHAWVFMWVQRICKPVFTLVL